MDISTDLVRLNVVSTGAGFTFKSYRRILWEWEKFYF
jgi:hypothetical protein